jgi:hypothetical protein
MPDLVWVLVPFGFAITLNFRKNHSHTQKYTGRLIDLFQLQYLTFTL